MACKKGKPGNPCCSPCINCTGTTFEVEAVSFAGTWGFPSSEDDSPSCPGCMIPGTFIFANSVTKEQLLGTDATPSGEQQCYRSVRQIGAYCQTQIYDSTTYSIVGFGHWKKTRIKIYAREWIQVDASFGAVRYGSNTRVSAGLGVTWFVQFISRKCEFITINPYGWPGPPPDYYADEASSLAAAKANELDAQCIFGEPDPAPFSSWKLCDSVQVFRNLAFYDDISGSSSCTPTICGALTHRSTTGERWLYDNGLYGRCTLDQDQEVSIKWKKDLDGSTPLLGDFTSTQQLKFSESTGGPVSTGNGTLTGTVTGQEFKVYGPGGATLLATLKEPCWPTTPTVDVVCNVEEPPPPEDP